MLLFPYIVSGQSPVTNNQSAPPAASTPEAANKDVEMTTAAFTSNSLNQPQVGTFQQRSIQKLKDFYNYLTIISNPKFDKRLRENVKIQAKQLFYGVDCKINGKPAYDFIDSCCNLQQGVEWKAVDVSVREKMAPGSSDSITGVYRGELSFKESVNSKLSGVKKAEIVLSKSVKQFGETKKEVWEVFICSIE